MDLALNNLQRLICHKTNQTKPIYPTLQKVINKVLARLELELATGTSLQNIDVE